MKLVNRIVLSSLAFILFISFQPEINAQTNSFYVYFKQNDKRFNSTEDKIELKKEPFEIYVEYSEPLDIIVHASVKSETYNKAMRGNLYHELSGMHIRKDLYSFFENFHTVILNESEPTIWHKGETDGEKEKKNEDGRFVCIKNVKSMLDVEEELVLLNENMEKGVHLVFLYAEKDETGSLIEIQREQVKIKWVTVYDEETKLYERHKVKTGKEKIRIAEQNLRQKQKMEKKEKKALDRLEKKKIKALERKVKKEKKRDEKEKQKLEEDREDNKRK